MSHKPKANVDAFVNALLESARMEDTERYLASGRRFAFLETDEIKQRWTSAARAFLVSGGKVDPREMDDLASELGLRKVELPSENIKGEISLAARQIERNNDPRVLENVRARIRRFLDQLDKPRN